MSDMSERDGLRLQDDVQTAIRTGVHAFDPNRIVTKALVVYECILEDGQRVLNMVPSEDMRAYDILGFTSYAEQVARTWVDAETRGER